MAASLDLRTGVRSRTYRLALQKNVMGVTKWSNPASAREMEGRQRDGTGFFVTACAAPANPGQLGSLYLVSHAPIESSAVPPKSEKTHTIKISASLINMAYLAKFSEPRTIQILVACSPEKCDGHHITVESRFRAPPDANKTHIFFEFWG
jgi:hypothetical protein